MRYLPDNNLSYPVLVEIGNSSGSGFYFLTEQKLFLATAQHVLYNVTDSEKALIGTTLKLTSYDENPNVKSPFELKADLSKVNIRKNDLKDIVLIEVGKIAENGTTIDFAPGTQKLSLHDPRIVVVPTENLKKFSEVLVSNEVFILGYPSSLGIKGNPQIETKKPLLRKGIIAGKNDSNETIILDCPVYFGNSGGIAIEVEQTQGFEKKFHIIGVVSQFLPFVEELKSLQLGYTNCNFENSGYSVAVPIDTLFELSRENPIT
jgi:hypothetical protein